MDMDMDQHWNLTGLDGRQTEAAGEVLPLIGVGFSADGMEVRCVSGSGLRASFDGKSGEIVYDRGVQLFRGLGLLAELVAAGTPGKVEETPAYDDLGIMLDCSRGAVPAYDSYCDFVRRMALMGYTSLQLYTEDTYEVPGYPYFGYLRGRISQEDLRRMDRYAALFSIELVPCIQTLAHLGNYLRWPAAREIHDCDDILMADEDKTYALVEAMIKTMSENVASRRINLGMDEAHMVGLGKYLDRHGYCDRTKLMLRHIERVLEITRRYGYRPMMWSDMFFRLACGDYYQADCKVDPQVARSIPEDVKLVYWDYYHDKQEVYDAMMEKHRELCPRLAFAGGAWNWTGYSPNSHFSEMVGRLAHESCRKNGIREAFVTIWGDNGAESSRFSVLPALSQWAELCYENDDSAAHMQTRFATCCGGSYADFMELDRLALSPDNPSPGRCGLNLSKPLLYQDVLTGIFDCHVGSGFKDYYAQCAAFFEPLRGGGQWAYLFETQYRLARVLELKCDAGVRIRAAYRENDRAALERYASEMLPRLLQRLESFMEAFRAQWTRENRAFGYVALDIRFGALQQRIRSAAEQLRDYLAGKAERIELLDEEILPYSDGENGELAYVPMWHEQACGQLLASI